MLKNLKPPEMKKLLTVLLLFAVVLPAVGQTDSIMVKKPAFKNQIDLDVEFLGSSISFKKELTNSNFAIGIKTGVGFILSIPKGSSRFYENIFFQPIINWRIKQIGYIETGPRISIVMSEVGEGDTSELIGLSLSVFVRLWKVQIGTRTQISFVSRNFSDANSSTLFSQEAVILRIPLN